MDVSTVDKASSADSVYEFGPFRLDADTMVLTRSGVPEPLGARAVAVLRALLAMPQQTVSKEAIFTAAWPGLVVEESNLSVQISAIRHVLATAPGGDRWIETLARRGYRFRGPVVELRNGIPLRLAPQSNVPQSLTSFVGRARERVEFKRLLAKRRLLTIVGPGGIGKTRLASEIASEIGPHFRDGTWFVDLAPLDSGEWVPNAVAQVLRVPQSLTRPLVELVCDFVRGRRLLLILDNCEHVVEAVAQFSETLLRTACEPIVIATSRQPLRINGEQVYRLGPLSLPAPHATTEAVQASEAVQLFVDRSQHQAFAFALDGSNASHIAELCIRLDGIPFALELAAARIGQLTIEDICARLNNRFELLSEGSRTALPRQQTLRAALDWSYELLSDRERDALRRLAIFAGSFTEIGAAAVVDGGSDLGETEVVLKNLVDRSLLIDDLDDVAPRYRLLETTRAYGLEQLEAAGEAAVVRRRHAAHFQSRFETALTEWLDRPDPEWRRRYLPDIDNVRNALRWSLDEGGDRPVAVALTGASGPLWTSLSLYRESLQRFATAVTAVDADTSPAHEARLYLWRGILSANGAPAEAAVYLERAVELYRGTPHRAELGHACARLAYVRMIGHRTADAAALLEDARPLIKASRSLRLLGYFHGMCGHLKALTDDLMGARSEFQRALTLFRKAGNEVSVLESVSNLADISWSLGELDAAEASLREYIAMRGSPYVRRSRLGFALANLAGVLTQRDDLDGALRAAREALPLLADAAEAWCFMDHFALRAALAGKLDDAAIIAGYADAIHAHKEAQRDPNEARARERLHALLRDRIFVRKLESLLERGAGMSEAEICQLIASE